MTMQGNCSLLLVAEASMWNSCDRKWGCRRKQGQIVEGLHYHVQDHLSYHSEAAMPKSRLHFSSNRSFWLSHQRGPQIWGGNFRDRKICWNVIDKNHGTDHGRRYRSGMEIELLSPNEVTGVGAVEKIRLVYLGIGWLRGRCKEQYRKEKFDRSD